MEITWFKALDPHLWTGLFFMFGGKAYAIFSMLFGFSFWVQFSRMQAKNYDMGGRFVWRLALLFGFGLIHSVYYSGDLLIFYSTFGLGLVLFRKVPDRIVLVVSILLLLMPLNLWQLGHILTDPSYAPINNRSLKFWTELSFAQGGGTLLELVKADLVSGLPANVIWTWESGRMFHIPGLFLLGMLAARRKVFTEFTSKRWLTVFIVSVVTFIPVHMLIGRVYGHVSNEVLRTQICGILAPYGDVIFMLSIVSAFMLLWRAGVGKKVFSVLIPYGRMSLTNYTSQALIGVFVYYECGFGLHHYFGATLSVMTGAVLLICQLVISHWWLRHFNQGPLEMLWRKLMWYGAPERIRR